MKVEKEHEKVEIDVENYTGYVPTRHIPTQFIAQSKKAYKKVKAYPSTKKEQLTVFSYLAYLRSTVYNKAVASSQTKSHQKGYRFPLKAFLTGNRVSNAWLYYYPSTSDLEHSVSHNFFDHIFPNEGEHEHIAAVHNHHNTEAFAIAIQDNIFHNVNVSRKPQQVTFYQ